MSQDTKCCFKPYGKVYMAQLPAACPSPLDFAQYEMKFVGNVTEVIRNISYNELNIPNLADASFGDACALKLPESEELDITFTCLKTDNLRKALGGTDTAEASQSIVDEQHSVPTDSACIFVRTDHLIDLDVAVVVNGPGGSPTYVEGTDYFLRSDGIELTVGTAISNEIIEITYTSQDYTSFNPSLYESLNYIMHFSGRNAVDGGTLTFTYYNLQFDPAETLNLLNEDFLTLTVTATALKSSCHFDSAGNALRSTFDLTD